MPPKRNNSGTRNGTTDLVRTIQSLETLSNKNISVSELENRFIQNYQLSYEGATEAEAKKKFTTLIKDHDWGAGQKLGRATDLVTAIKNNKTTGGNNPLVKQVMDAVKTATYSKQQVGQIAEEDTARTKLSSESKAELEKKGNQIEKILKRRKDIPQKKEKTKEEEQKRIDEIVKLYSDRETVPTDAAEIVKKNY